MAVGIVFSLSLSFLSGFAGPVLWFWLRLFFVGFCFCLSKKKSVYPAGNSPAAYSCFLGFTASNPPRVAVGVQPPRLWIALTLLSISLSQLHAALSIAAPPTTGSAAAPSIAHSLRRQRGLVHRRKYAAADSRPGPWTGLQRGAAIERAACN